MINSTPLLSKHQHTLAKPTGWVIGTTLRNVPARMRFLPAPPNSGRIIRIFVKGKLLHEFKVSLAGSKLGHTWTDAIDPVTKQGIGVVEHPAAAVVLAGLDNVILEVDYPQRRAATILYAKAKSSSVPLMNGTAEPHLAAIFKAGVISQKVPRQWLKPTQPFSITRGNSTFTVKPRAQAGWSLSAQIPTSSAWWRKHQLLTFRYDISDNDAAASLQSIATARPANYKFIEYLAFKLTTLGKGRTADFTIIHTPFSRQPIHNQPSYGQSEAVLHRHLDILGDIFFFTGYLQADITAIHTDHPFNHRIRQWLVKHPEALK